MEFPNNLRIVFIINLLFKVRKLEKDFNQCIKAVKIAKSSYFMSALHEKLGSENPDKFKEEDLKEHKKI